MSYVLEIESLSFKYNRSKELFCDLSFCLEMFEKLYIKGRNGSGKTTLLQLIAGFITPQRGIIKTKAKVDGFFVDFVSFIFPLSIEENFRFFLKGLDKKQRNLIQEMAEDLDFSLDLGKKFRSFSHGEKDKIMFIKALISPADIIVMDEPFASMDEKSAVKGVGLLEKIKKTVIFTSHNHSIVPEYIKIIDLDKRQRN